MRHTQPAPTSYSTRAPSLSDVVTKAAPGGNVILMHSQPGWGKTSTFASVPNALFIMANGETGLLTLMNNGQVGDVAHYPIVMEEWVDVLLAVQEVNLSQHPYKMLVIDTFTGAIKLAEKLVCKTKYNDDMGKFAAFGGDASAKETLVHVSQMMGVLRAIANKGITVVLLCHSELKKVKNPDGLDWDTWTPSMHKVLWGEVSRLCDIVLFGYNEVFVEANGANGPGGASKVTRGKAKSSNTQMIRAAWSPTAEAKNRHGMPDTLVGGSSALETARILSQAINKNKPQQQPEKASEVEGQHQPVADAVN